MILKVLTLATVPECQKNIAIVPPTVFSTYLCQTISYPPTLHSANE